MKKKCDKCDNPATIHLTEILGGKKIEKHLCEDCAAEDGITIKANIPISLKHSLSLEETLQTLKDHVELTRDAAETDTDLVIWAETMMPAPMNEVADADLIGAFLTHKDEAYRRSGRFLADCAKQLKDALSAANTTMLIGAETRGEKRYNSAYLIAPDGDVIGRYDKMHLVVFGEYTPLTRLFPFLPDRPRDIP